MPCQRRFGACWLNRGEMPRNLIEVVRMSVEVEHWLSGGPFLCEFCDRHCSVGILLGDCSKRNSFDGGGPGHDQGLVRSLALPDIGGELMSPSTELWFCGLVVTINMPLLRSWGILVINLRAYFGTIYAA